MLISVRQLRTFWGVKAAGVLHVGAHEAEELEDYRAAGWEPVVWVEALPDKAATLQHRFSGNRQHTVIPALARDEDNVVLSMRRTNNGQSSSALALGTHLVEHPKVQVVDEFPMLSSRLDTLLKGSTHRFDFINLDVQGAELRALRGLGDRLRAAHWVYCEVNEKALYVGAALVNEIDSYLGGYGFRRVDTEMTRHGWGDALYTHDSSRPRFPGTRRYLRRLATRARRSRISRVFSKLRARG